MNITSDVCVCLVYLQGLGGSFQLCHRVVVRQQVGQLALIVQRRKGGQILLQLADPLLMSLRRREGEKVESKRRGNGAFLNTFVGCYDSERRVKRRTVREIIEEKGVK